LPVYNFGQQRLNGAANCSATKDAEFCHTSNIFLVVRGHRHALLRLYFNFSPVGWLVVGQSVSQLLVGQLVGCPK
jgi:hypothetical protein